MKNNRQLNATAQCTCELRTCPTIQLKEERKLKLHYCRENGDQMRIPVAVDGPVADKQAATGSTAKVCTKVSVVVGNALAETSSM